MTRSRLLAVTALCMVLVSAASLRAQTVILVRHAEKMDQSADPELSPAGAQRAEMLKQALAHFPVQAIFVSEYRRTRETALPTAGAFHVTPVVIAVHGDVNAQVAATAKAVLALKPGTAALVVGHSNTVGPIITALGGPAVGDLCDGEYATIFVLELTPGTAPRLLRASYGTPDPPAATVCHP